MKVVVVVPNLGAGGAERVVTLLARSWADGGDDVTIVTIDPSRADFYDVGSRVERVTVQTKGARAAAVLPLRRVFAEQHPDVIVSFITVTNLLSIVAAAGLRVPVVVAERLDPREHRIPRSMHVVRDILYRRAAALVVLTEGVAEWARSRMSPQKVYVIPNFAREASVKRPPGGGGSHRVTGIGRLVDQKGFDMLLDAFAAAAPAPWTLEIFGDGPDRLALEARARSLGIAERVWLRGVVADPEQRLAASEIFVLSSRYEGFPNALCEAMAARVPSIAFDAPSGPSELIRNEIDGLLVPREDVDALTRALRRIIEDPDLRERLAARAPEVTQRFPQADAVAKWTALIHGLTTLSS